MGDAVFTEAYHAAVDALPLPRCASAHSGPVHRWPVVSWTASRTWLRGVRGSRPNGNWDCDGNWANVNVGADRHAAWDDLVRFLKEVRE